MVHKGESVDKGHHVDCIQPSYDQSWALFDEQTVKWVKEEEVLRQEAFLLIYFLTTPPIVFDGRKTNQPTNITRETPTTTTQHQPPLLGSDITGTVSPESREEPTYQPDSLLTSMDDENDQHGNRKTQPRTSHTPTQEEDQTGKQRGLQQFQDSLREKLERSSTEWTPLSTIIQCLSGLNRKHPSTILSNLDIQRIQTWIEQEQDIASYIKTCSCILWKQGSKDVLLVTRPSRTTPTVPHLQTFRNQGRITTPTLHQRDEGDCEGIGSFAPDVIIPAIKRAHCVFVAVTNRSTVNCHT